MHKVSVSWFPYHQHSHWISFDVVKLKCLVSSFNTSSKLVNVDAAVLLGFLRFFHAFILKEKQQNREKSIQRKAASQKNKQPNKQTKKIHVLVQASREHRGTLDMSIWKVTLKDVAARLPTTDLFARPPPNIPQKQR